ncbi:Aldehyde dehydrogenase (pyrroloquinoline-quinone) [Allomuricauda ruestringensis DSM 13258]|uniref:Aldehyde dehydrogenase (Pyrroloquinoline-quinone) n=1 Tax=Allomuricauda ruestringensis (strain DSM 13258 / CIP 107369 / LMG 19739 / B1) TaxID=886377 RepID=G2PJ79_ALLRU|nr:molybdopterin cofactor-binding domain-containing protein [Allomuricauda ruestringensis]AEM71900.1 Aldehyde dehydrogenase (pyrroloquinoline-quinone) [Allomuricauda ruestringensis DSM 13258]
MTPVTNRRNFIKNTLMVSSGLAVGFTVGNVTRLFSVEAGSVSHELSPFIHIDTESNITLVNPNPDMGQGSIQASAAMIAEELEVRLEEVRIIPSDGQAKYDPQISGGSGAVRRSWEPLRKAGAAVRIMLLNAASRSWKIPLAECYAEDAHIYNRIDDRKFKYGDLVTLASTLEVPENPILKSKSEFKLIGKSHKRGDVIERITGKSTYSIDMQVPGMVHAAILHSPTILGKVVSINATEALKVNGVIDVVKCERTMPYTKFDAVAVIANSSWAAMQGKKALQVEWGDEGDHLSTQDYSEGLYAAADNPGALYSETGAFDQHFTKSRIKAEGLYESNFLSHASIEPMNGIVEVKDNGTVEVWAGVQGSGQIKDQMAEYMEVPLEHVKVNVKLMGGSFGRKSYHDFLLEAGMLSKKIQKPVKVTWTREEDISQGPYRAGSLSKLQGTVENGKITGLHHHAIGESIAGQLDGSPKVGEVDEGLGREIGFENNKYVLDHTKISFTRVAADIPIMWWRSVYAGSFAFGQECFIDELAHLGGIDPLKARLEILEDERYRLVLNTLAEKANYHEALPEGIARGIAIWKSFESISAACVFIVSEGQGVRVKKVVSVLDCGLFVNEDMVRAQMEGSIVMGLSAATKEEITYENGACIQQNFHQYELMRIHEAPEMETHIIANQDTPGGVGEPALPPIAPALNNAIFNLTGVRLRKLPMDLSNIKLN